MGNSIQIGLIIPKYNRGSIIEVYLKDELLITEGRVNKQQQEKLVIYINNQVIQH